MADDSDGSERRVVHLVLLRLHGDADVVGVFAALRALRGAIPGLLSFSGGANTSTEGLSAGFTHAFTMVFSSAAARDAYLPHPLHDAAKALVLPALDGPPGEGTIHVLDYELGLF